MERMHGTTIIAVHRNGVSAVAGDGQVTLGDTIVKKGAVKVRPLADGEVITGFAGSVSDAFTLLEKTFGWTKKLSNICIAPNTRTNMPSWGRRVA